MENFLLYLITFILAGIFSVLEILNIKYRKIAAFILTSPALYSYAIFFGLIGAGILWSVQNNKMFGDVSLLPGSESSFAKAILIGVFTKAFFDLKIFSFSIGPDKAFPVGIKTFSHFVEEPLLSKMEVHWFKNYSKFIDKVNAQHQSKTVDEIHNLVVDRLQNFPDESRVVAFLNGEFNKVTTKKDKYSLVMREFGKDVFCQVFQC
jgi:hypothetical protein